ncbi:hypothetical protein BaOVIS_032370 [Babesia ovis]|uniref:Uncharacterized protein n=1 Tax=Babesia ovis TaxID=5869 RepID=A0A9W5TEK8_BABOV|nr:hypothetical protein BaOVIS_032370 [Babesia ovis]
MKSRRCAERKPRRRLCREVVHKTPRLPEGLIRHQSETIDIDEVIFCVLDSLVDGNPETENAATNAVLRFARLQQNFTIRAILHFLEVQRTTESHQRQLLSLLRKCITQSHDTIPSTVMRDVLLFMLKELNFLDAGDPRQSVIVETVNETAVLCPAFSVEVILAFIRDMRQESSCLTDTLCVYIRVLTHVYSQACHNDYIRSVDVVGQILSLYDKSTLSVEAGELCKNLASLLCTLSKALYTLDDYMDDSISTGSTSGICEALDLEDLALRKFTQWYCCYENYTPSIDRPNGSQMDIAGLDKLGSLFNNISTGETDVVWSARSHDSGSQISGNRPVVRSLRLGSQKRVLSFAAALHATQSVGEVNNRFTSSATEQSISIGRSPLQPDDVSNIRFDSLLGDFSVSSGNQQGSVHRSLSLVADASQSTALSPLEIPTKGNIRSVFRNLDYLRNIDPLVPKHKVDVLEPIVQTVSGPMGIPTVGVPADFQDVLEPLYGLMIEQSLVSIYTHPHYHVSCLEALFGLSMLFKHVSSSVITLYGATLLDSIIVKFYHYIPSMQYHNWTTKPKGSSVWMSMHRESSDTYRNKIATIFSSIGAYGDKVSMLPPSALVIALLHLCKVLLKRYPQCVVTQLPNICEVLFGMLMGLHACGKANLLASCDSSLVSFKPDEDMLLRKCCITQFLDVNELSDCKHFVRTLVAACRFFSSSPLTRCYFFDFLFRKAEHAADREVSVALFMLGWSCSLSSLRDSLIIPKSRNAMLTEIAKNGPIFWRLIDTLHMLLGKVPMASANPHMLRLLVALINHLSRGHWLLLHCLAGYKAAPNYGSDFYPTNAQMRVTRAVHALIDFVFSLKVVYDLEKRITENEMLTKAVNQKLNSDFFRKMYCGHHASTYDTGLLVTGSRSFEKFLVSHSGDCMFVYLCHILLTNSKMSVFTALRALCSLFTKSNNDTPLTTKCSLQVLNRLLALVLVYLHDPVNYFCEAYAAAKALPCITELIYRRKIALYSNDTPKWSKADYRGLDVFVLIYEPGDTYGHLSGTDHIVHHFEKTAKVLRAIASLPNGDGNIDILQQLLRISQGLKPPPTTYTSLLKLVNLQSSNLLTAYHGLGILQILGAFSYHSVDMCSAMLDVLLGYRGPKASGSWDNGFPLDQSISALIPSFLRNTPLMLNISEQMRYTMLQLGIYTRTLHCRGSAFNLVDHVLQDANMYFVTSSDDYLQQELYIISAMILANIARHKLYRRPVLARIYYSLRSKLPSTGALFTKFTSSNFGDNLKHIAITALCYIYRWIYSVEGDNLLDTVDIASLALEVSQHQECVTKAAEESHLVQKYNACFRENSGQMLASDLGHSEVIRCVIAPLLYFNQFETDSAAQLAIARGFVYMSRDENFTPQDSTSYRFPLVALRRILYFISKPTLKEFGANIYHDSSSVENQCVQLFKHVSWDLNFEDIRPFETTLSKNDTLSYCSSVSMAYFAALCIISDTIVPSDNIIPSLDVILSFSDFWHCHVTQVGTRQYIDCSGLVSRFMRNSVEQKGWLGLSQIMTMALFLGNTFSDAMIQHRLSLILEFLRGLDLSKFPSVYSSKNKDNSLPDPGTYTNHGGTETTVHDCISPECSAEIQSFNTATSQQDGDNTRTQPNDDRDDHMCFIESVLMLWAHIIRLDSTSPLRAAVGNSLERLLYYGRTSIHSRTASITQSARIHGAVMSPLYGPDHMDPQVIVQRNMDSIDHLQSIAIESTVEMLHDIPQLVDNRERIDLLIPKESLMLALLCCMKYLSATSCLSESFAEILQLILQERYSDLDHEHLESILASIFCNFSPAFENSNVPCSLHNFVIDLAQTDFDVLCNVIFAKECSYSPKFRLSVTALVTTNCWLMLQLLEFLENCLLSRYRLHCTSGHTVPMDYILDFVEHIYLSSDEKILYSSEGIRFITALVLHFYWLLKHCKDDVLDLCRFKAICSRLVTKIKGDTTSNNKLTQNAISAHDGHLVTNGTTSYKCFRSVLMSSMCYIKYYISFLETLLQSQVEYKTDPTHVYYQSGDSNVQLHTEYKLQFVHICLSLFCSLLRDGAFRLHGSQVLGLIHRITLLKDYKRFYYRALHYYIAAVELAPTSLYTRRLIVTGVPSSRSRHSMSYNTSDDEFNGDVMTPVVLGTLAVPTDGVDGLRHCVLDRLVLSILDDISQPLTTNVLYWLQRAAGSLLKFVTAHSSYRVRNLKLMIARLLRSYHLLCRDNRHTLTAFTELYMAIAQWLKAHLDKGWSIPVEVQRHLLPPLGIAILHRDVLGSSATYTKLLRSITKVITNDHGSHSGNVSDLMTSLKALLMRKSSHLVSSQWCMCGCNNPTLKHYSGDRFCICYGFYLLDLFSSCFPMYKLDLEAIATESIGPEMARLRKDEHMKRTTKVLFGNYNDANIEQSMLMGRLAAISSGGTLIDHDRGFVDLSDIYQVRPVRLPTESSNNPWNNWMKQSPSHMLTARSIRTGSFDEPMLHSDIKRCSSADGRIYDTSDDAVNLLLGLSAPPSFDPSDINHWYTAQMSRSMETGNRYSANSYNSLESLRFGRRLPPAVTVPTNEQVLSNTAVDSKGLDTLCGSQLEVQRGETKQTHCVTQSINSETSENCGNSQENIDIMPNTGRSTKNVDDPLIENTIVDRSVASDGFRLPPPLKRSISHTSSVFDEFACIPADKTFSADNTPILRSAWFGRPMLPHGGNLLALPHTGSDIGPNVPIYNRTLIRRKTLGKALNRLPCLPNLMQLVNIADFEVQCDGHLKRIHTFTGDAPEPMNSMDSSRTASEVTFFDISNLEVIWNSTLYTSPLVYRHLLIKRYMTRPSLYIKLFGGEHKHACHELAVEGYSIKSYQTDSPKLDLLGQLSVKSEPTTPQAALAKLPDTQLRSDTGCIPEHVIVNAIRGAAAILHLAVIYLNSEEDRLRQYILERWPHCFIEMARYNAIMHFDACAKLAAKQLCKMVDTSSGNVKRVLLESMELFAMIRSNSLNCD